MNSRGRRVESRFGISVEKSRLDLPKSFWKKGRDDLSRTAHNWITQLDSRTVFGTADGTFDHTVWPIADRILLFPEGR